MAGRAAIAPQRLACSYTRLKGARVIYAMLGNTIDPMQPIAAARRCFGVAYGKSENEYVQEHIGLCSQTFYRALRIILFLVSIRCSGE
jgi:hypothetical protein